MQPFQAPVRDYRFLLEELYVLEGYAALPGFADLTSDLLGQILEEGGKFVSREWQPLNPAGDRQGCIHHPESGTVTTPEGFRKAYQGYFEAGWGSLSLPESFGGQGLPAVVAMAMDEFSNSANMSLTMYPVLTRSAVEALLISGSEEQKKTYVPKMVSGTWTGSMNLTEPHCGTDLGLIRTRAEPREDGTYRINGTKIFITSGEHDLAENIIHLVLARLPDAPAGIKGISMFIVPKFLVERDGRLGERNGISCASIESKMGIHGNVTCVLNYEDAVAHLVGEPHRGMRSMFIMMNDARLGAGVQGLALSEIAYQHAVAYAKERRQGRAVDQVANAQQSADPILAHPDIRRMLLTIRAFNEGARSLAVYAALMVDVAHKHEALSMQQGAQDFLALMTPVIKAFFTDHGFENTSLALQCFGGHGYIRETGVEQFVRDVRITKIYEGTNGIQALDLVFRKLPAHSGRYLKQFFGPVESYIENNGANTDLGVEFVNPLAAALDELKSLTALMTSRVSDEPAQAAAAAADYLRLFGIIALAFEWSKMAKVSFARMADSSGNTAIFEDKIALGRFYMMWILPETTGLAERIRFGTEALLGFPQDRF